MGQTKLIQQGAVSLGAVERVEVFALDILDQRHLRLRKGVNVFPNNGRDHRKTCKLRGAETTLTRDKLITLPRLSNNDRLNHAIGLHACREVAQPFVAELAPGLMGIGDDAGEK